MDLSRVLSECLDLAARAGDQILDIYRGEVDATVKADGSPLTRADETANRTIVEGLLRAFPGTAILSEESPDNAERLDQDWCFLVDPLDGTKEFLARNGEFTVNIALVHRGEPVLGVVSAPALNEVYWAHQGAGAWWSRPGRSPQRLACAPAKTPLRLAVSRSHRSPEEDLFIREQGIEEVLPMGSSLKGCLVARGAADLYLRAGTVMEWDIAAMDAVVREAGGTVYRWGTSQVPVLYNQVSVPRVPGFVCASPGVPPIRG